MGEVSQAIPGQRGFIGLGSSRKALAPIDLESQEKRFCNSLTGKWYPSSSGLTRTTKAIRN